MVQNRQNAVNLKIPVIYKPYLDLAQLQANIMGRGYKLPAPREIAKHPGLKMSSHLKDTCVIVEQLR